MEQLPLFQEGSPANRSARPESEEARRMTATSGRRCYESFASYPRHTLWQKMFLDCFLSTMEPSSSLCYLTWSVQDTKHSRSIIRLRASVPRTSETEFSLWPTPVTVDTGARFNRSDSPNATNRPTLGAMAKYGLWPTPAASMWKGTGRPGSKSQEWDNATGRLKGDSRLFENGQTGQLNPAWVEALQGFPPGWTEVE
jgi:hypothetical protein